MKLKKLFVLALALCIMTMVVPGAFAAGLTLDYGTSGIPVVEEPTRVVYNNVMNSRSSAGPITTTGKGLTLTKGVSETTTDGVYQIDLTAKSDSVIVSKGKPCDIILVLDGSGSMGENNDANFGKLKKAILGNNEDATSGFLKTVFDNSKESRVAIVRYSSDATVLTGTKQATSGAFVSISNATGTAVNSDLITAVTTGAAPDTANDSAYSNKGLAAATSIFHDVTEADEVNYDNERTVILFTDGVPGEGAWVGIFGSDYGWSSRANGPAENSAMDSIHWSTILKGQKDKPVSVDTSQRFVLARGNDFNNQNSTQKGCGATIYTVAVFPNSGIYNDDFTGLIHSQACAINEYMYRVSSDCPTGAHVPGWDFAYTNARTRNLSDGHYLVENNGNLSNIFHQIATETGVQATVVVRDYIPDYMQICDSSGIPVTSATYTLADSSEVKIAADSTGTYIEWPEVELKPKTSEFASYFNVKFVDGFMGGDSIPTNLAASGVFNGGESAYVAFGVPTVDVALKYSISHENAMVYLSNSFDQDNLFDEGTVDGIKNRFVTLVYTSTNGDTCTVEAGSTLSSSWLSSVTPNNCSDYTLSCTITSVNNSENTDEATATATVHVLKPTLTGSDAHIKMGVEAPMAATHEWNTTCGCQGIIPKVTGLIPEVTYDYSKTEENKYPSACTNYTVSAVIGGTKDAVSGQVTGGTPYTDIDDVFMIHVHAPTLDGSVYNVKLGSSTTLDSDNVTLGWSETCVTHPNEEKYTGSFAVDPVPVFAFDGKENSKNVTPTECKAFKAELAKIGEVTPAAGTYTADIMVHVHEPSITGSYTTIFLGNKTTLDANDVTLTWAEKCVCRKTEGSPSGRALPTYTFGGQASGVAVAPKECTDYKAELIKIGGVTPVKGTYTSNVTVHVVYPVITTQDQTIYLGDAPTYADPDVDWDEKCEDGDTYAPEDERDAPKYKFSFAPQEADFTTCNPVDVTVYLGEIGENSYTEYTQYATFVNGNTKHKGSADSPEFTIHVLRPTIKFQDTYIYRGNRADFNNNYLSETTWTEAVNHGKTTADAGDVPAVTPSYDRIASAFAACTDVNVTGIKIGEKVITNFESLILMKNGTDTRGADKMEFTVHVLQPTFTVTTQDIWADYKTTFNLTEKCIVGQKAVLGWADETEGHSVPETLPDGAPFIVSETFTFNKGTAGDYLVGTADETVTVSKLTFTLNNSYGADYTLDGKTFIIHVNKFDLTINTDWSASDGEQQNAIFIVTPKTPDKNVKSFKVVVPADADSVIVKGLFCGQEYTIAEDNAWTWRYANPATANYSENKTCITCAGGLSLVDLAGTDSVTMSYVDTGYNAKWLAGEDCVVNKINPQTQNAVVIPADRKKDEEVNA